MIPLTRAPLILALTLTLFLLALGPTTLAEDGQGGMSPAEGTSVPPVGFHLQGDQVVGALVSFTYAPDGGPIQNFAYQGPEDGGSGSELLFQAVTVPGYHGVNPPSIDGAIFWADGGVANLTVHDSPTAAIQVMAQGPAQVTFVLAPGAEVESQGSGISQARHCVALDKPVRGSLLSPDGTLVVQDGQVTATLTGPGMVLFRALPRDGEGTPGDERAVCESIGDRRVAAEVDIKLMASGPRVEGLGYRQDTQVSVTKVTRGHLELRVRASRPEGTRVYLRLDPTVATAADARGLKVSLDNSPVASSPLTDVLYAQGASAQDARYAALVQGPGLGVLAYIPRLSPGGVTLTIDAIGPFTPVVDVPTLEVMALGVAVVALATFALFRRRG